MSEIGGDFTLNASGILSQLQRVDSAIMSVSKRAAGVAAGFAAAGAAMAAAFATIDRGVRSAAAMETINSEFSVLLGSAERAKELIDEVLSSSLGKVLGVDAVASGAKTMLQFGASLESVMPSLDAIGNIAGSNKQRFDSLTLAFAQMSATGRLMGQDLLQMVNAGFNPLQEISRLTGRSLVDLKKDMEGGAISAQMVADAFQSATSEGGRFFGNLAAQSETGIGYMSQLQAAVDSAYRAFGAPILDALKPVLAEAITQMQAFVPIAGEVGQTLVAVTRAAASMAGPITALTPLWVMLAARATGADIALQRFFVSAGAGAWAGVTAGIQRANAALGAFGYTLARTGSLAAATRTGLVSLGVTGSGAFLALANAARAAGAAIAAAFGPVGLIIAGVTLAIQKAFEWFTKLKASTEEAAAAIKSTGKEFTTDVQRARGISSESERGAFLEEQRGKWSAARDAGAAAMEAGNDKVADVYYSQADAIQRLIQWVERMPRSAISANAAVRAATEESTQSLDRQANAAEEAAKAMREFDAAQEARKGLADQRANILREFDMPNEAAMDRRIERDRAAISGGTAEDWQVAQLPRLLEAREKLYKIEKQISDEKKKQADDAAEAAKAASSWRQQTTDQRDRALADAADAGTDDSVESEKVRLAQMHRDLVAEAQEIGGMQLAEAQAYADTIVAAERQALDAKRAAAKMREDERKAKEAEAAAQWQQDFGLAMDRAAAAASGDKDRVRAIDLEQRRRGYIREGMEQGGLSEAEATALADRRVQLEAMQQEEESPGRARVDALFADSLARVGGGGGVAGRGVEDPVLRENQRQSSLLSSLVTEMKAVRETLKKGGATAIAVAA